MRKLIRFIKQYTIPFFFIAISLVALIALILFIVEFFNNGISKKPSDWAIFATYVSGTIGTLIGLVSIILLYQTLRKQTELSRLQQFESSFFSLLENQRDIIKSMKGNVSYELISGKTINDNFEGTAFIEKIARAVESKFNFIGNFSKNGKDKFSIYENSEKCRKLVNKQFDTIYNQHKAQLGHYFRHLYYLFKYVEDSKINNIENYFGCVQAQMSDDELYITLIYVISDLGYENFLPIVKKYNLFENISSRHIDFDKMRKLFFPHCAFKSYSLTIDPPLKDVTNNNQSFS